MRCKKNWMCYARVTNKDDDDLRKKNMMDMKRESKTVYEFIKK